MKRVILFAVSWLVFGFGLALFGISQSLSNGWKTALYIVLFGPPIWLLGVLVFEGIGEGLQNIFVPKSIDNWHPVWRIAFFIIYTTTILLIIVAALYFLPRLIQEHFP